MKEEIAARLPQIRSEVDFLIQELIQLLESANPLDFVSQFALNNLTRSENDPENRDKDEVRVEYLVSLAMALECNVERPTPPPDKIQYCFDLIKQIFEKATAYHAFSKGINGFGEDPKVELSILLQLNTLAVRGDGFYPHMRQRFEDVLLPFEDTLVEFLGFGVSDVHNFLARVEAEFNERIEEERRTRVVPLSDAVRTPKFIPFGKEVLDASFQEFFETDAEKFLELKKAFDGFGMSGLFLVQPKSGVEERILEALSCRLGENKEFLERIPKFRGWPLNPSIFTRKPIIKTDSGYFLFHLQFLGRAIFSIVHQLLNERAPEVLDRVLKARDRYAESESLQLFSTALPGCMSYANLAYDATIDGSVRRTEVDGLVIFDDVLIVLEAKAQGISPPARRGAPSAMEDLEATLGVGSYQADRFCTELEKHGSVQCYDENGKPVLMVDREAFHRIIPVVVSFDLLPIASGKVPLLRQLGILKGDRWPWIICLDDLRVVTEILDRPSTFLHYITRRIRINDFPKFEAHDELDYMMSYIENGLYLDHDPRFEGADNVALVGFTDRLEDYYSRLAGFSNKGKRPKVRLSPRTKQFLDCLEKQRKRHFTSATIELLDYDDKSREELFDSWTERLQRLRQSGKAVFSSLSFHQESRLLGVCFVNQLSVWTDIVAERCLETTMPQANASCCILVIVEPPFAAGKHEIRILQRKTEKSMVETA